MQTKLFSGSYCFQLVLATLLPQVLFRHNLASLAPPISSSVKEAGHGALDKLR